MREYTREINGVVHTFQCRDEDAERCGLKPARHGTEPDQKHHDSHVKGRRPRNKGGAE
jgi:hypothetical protein